MKYGMCFATSVILTVILLSVTVYGTDNVKILLYHDLVEEIGEKDNGDYRTTRIKFEKDITDALSLDYKSLNLADYYLGNYDSDERYFIITFDDGYLSNYTIALPILKKHKVYADIFIITDYTGLSNHFSWRQGQVMEDSGYVTLYSHTTRHQRSDRNGLLYFLNQLSRSFDMLSMKLASKRYNIFAYPEGVCSLESVAALSETGVVMQLVQTLPDWDYSTYGLHVRHNVSFKTDIKEILIKPSPGV